MFPAPPVWIYRWGWVFFILLGRAGKLLLSGKNIADGESRRDITNKESLRDSLLAKQSLRDSRLRKFTHPAFAFNSLRDSSATILRPVCRLRPFPHHHLHPTRFSTFLHNHILTWSTRTAAAYTSSRNRERRSQNTPPRINIVYPYHCLLETAHQRGMGMQ